MIGSEIRIIRIETDDFKSDINKIKSKGNVLIILNRTIYGLNIKIQGDNLSIENYVNELSLIGIPFN